MAKEKERQNITRQTIDGDEMVCPLISRIEKKNKIEISSMCIEVHVEHERVGGQISAVEIGGARVQRQENSWKIINRRHKKILHPSR